ncbi:unnamed protein product [Brassica rapa]|nr:unnamed protein product [Brassica rapa]
MAAERLRDLSKPMDVALLDSTVDVFYATGSKEERAAADNILRDLKANPDTWLQVTHILQNTRSTHTKYFALQVLEGVIKYRWKALPVVQRDGMKIYISDVIVELSKNEASFRSERLYINKLNLILVQILKHEWPANWRSFIPDLVNAAKTSESICENSMAILKLLSEEIFNFSRGEMIQRKINDLKDEFKLIHELCLYVLSASKRPALIRATLSALHAYLSWIPLSYIFQSPLMENLLKFFSVPAYRDLILQCLSKVAALKYEEHYRNQVVQMYMIFMKHLEGMLPFNINIPEAYSAGSTEEQASLLRANILYFTLHINILETTSETIPFLLAGLEYLIKISYVDDTEVFKVCCDYWHLLVSELFTSGQRMVFHPPTVGSIEPEITTPKILYSDQLSKLRGLMITRMAKPEEVLIVEDENGNIVRETMKDSDVLLQYKLRSLFDIEKKKREIVIEDHRLLGVDMGQTFRKLFDTFFGNQEMRVVMLGLDAAGKTTILYKLHIGEVLSTVPTIGFNVEKVQYKNVMFTVWDVGGQEKLRPLWRHYFNNTDGLIYVVDSLDRERIGKAKQEFQEIIKDPFMLNSVILVFANKQDMRGAMSPREVCEGLGLLDLKNRKWHIQGTCALQGDGLYEGLDWLSSTLKEVRAAGFSSAGPLF